MSGRVYPLDQGHPRDGDIWDAAFDSFLSVEVPGPGAIRPDGPKTTIYGITGSRASPGEESIATFLAVSNISASQVLD